LQDFKLEDLIIKEIEPVLTGMGFSLVELKVGFSTNLVSISLVIHSPTGVTVNDCAKVSETIHPILETVEGCENFTLRVMSPGLDRVIKNKREYGIFKGRNMRLWLKDGKDWIKGLLKDAREESILVVVDKNEKEIPLADIKKAILE
jgi:ribosome maturation factor RimP